MNHAFVILVLLAGCAARAPGAGGSSSRPDQPEVPVDARVPETSGPDADRSMTVDTADDTAPALVDAAPDAAASVAGDAAPGGPVAHRFLKGVSSEGSGTVGIVGKDGKIEWEYPITGEANDAWVLANGDVLFAFKTGCREVTPSKQIVWEWKATGGETHACQPLGDGLFLVGESRSDGTSSLYEIDSGLEVKKTITLNLGGGSHGQLREARKTPQGTYLTVQQRGGGKAQEWDATGKLLRTFPCGSFVAIRLPDGNTLIACGDDHRFIEVDPHDAVVWEVTEKELPGNQIGFAAGMQRLPNGNTVLCNWAGHSHLHAQPQVIELTRDKKIVWSVSDAKLGPISNIEILDPDVLAAPLR
jgi:hypothetical protein